MYCCCPRANATEVSRDATFVLCDDDPWEAVGVSDQVEFAMVFGCWVPVEHGWPHLRPFWGFVNAHEPSHDLLRASGAARNGWKPCVELYALGVLDDMYAIGRAIRGSPVALRGAAAEPKRIAKVLNGKHGRTINRKRPFARDGGDRHRTARRAAKDKAPPAKGQSASPDPRGRSTHGPGGRTAGDGEGQMGVPTNSETGPRRQRSRPRNL